MSSNSVDAFSMLAVVATLVVMMALTVPLSRRIVPTNNFWYAVAFAPTVSVAMVILLSSILFYFVPIQVAAWMCVLLIAMLGVVFAYVDRSPIWKAVRTARPVFVVSCLAALLCVWAVLQINRMRILFLDEPIHLSLTSTIANGNFPVMSPWAPGVASKYHYGVDLHAAVMQLLTGQSPVVLAELMHPWYAVCLACSVMGLVFALSRSWIAAVIGVLFSIFAPHIVSYGLPDVTFSGFQSIDKIVANWIVTAGFNEYRDIVDPGQIVVPQRIFGRSLLVMSLFMAIRIRHATTTHFVIMGTLVGMIAVVEIGIFAIALVALSAVLAWELFLSSPTTIKDGIKPVICIGTAIIVSIFVGGPVTDTLLHSAGDASLLRFQIPKALTYLTTLVENREDRVIGFAPWMNVGWSLTTGLLVFAAIVLRSRQLGVLSVAGVAGVAIFSVLSYTANDDSSRLIEYSSTISVIGLVSTAGLFINGFKASLTRATLYTGFIVLIVLPSVGPGLISSLRSAAYVVANSSVERDEYNRLSTRSRYAAQLTNSSEMLSWIRANVPRKASILSPWPISITIGSGRYGLLTPVGIVQNEPFAGPRYIDAWTSLDVTSLGELGAEFIHVDFATFSALSGRVAESLSEPERYSLIYDSFDNPNALKRHRLYKLVMPLKAPATPPLQSLRETVSLAQPVFFSGAIPGAIRPALAVVFKDLPIEIAEDLPGHLRTELDVRNPQADTQYLLYPDWFHYSYVGNSMTAALSLAGVSVYDLNSFLGLVGPIRPGESWEELPMNGPVKLQVFSAPSTVIDIRSVNRTQKITSKGGVYSISIEEQGSIFVRSRGGPTPAVLYATLGNSIDHNHGHAHGHAHGGLESNDKHFRKSWKPGVAAEADYIGDKIVVRSLWSDAGQPISGIGFEWVMLPMDIDLVDAPDVSSPGIEDLSFSETVIDLSESVGARWPSGLNSSASFDMVLEQFDLRSLRPSLINPETGELLVNDGIRSLPPGPYMVYLTAVKHSSTGRTPLYASPIYKLHIGQDETPETFASVGELDPRLLTPVPWMQSQ